MAGLEDLGKWVVAGAATRPRALLLLWEAIANFSPGAMREVTTPLLKVVYRPTLAGQCIQVLTK